MNEEEKTYLYKNGGFLLLSIQNTKGIVIHKPLGFKKILADWIISKSVDLPVLINAAIKHEEYINNIIKERKNRYNQEIMKLGIVGISLNYDNDIVFTESGVIRNSVYFDLLSEEDKGLETKIRIKSFIEKTREKVNNCIPYEAPEEYLKILRTQQSCTSIKGITGSNLVIEINLFLKKFDIELE
jgi:hypothetical protein